MKLAGAAGKAAKAVDVGYAAGGYLGGVGITGSWL
jgi:hypothetical protein